MFTVLSCACYRPRATCPLRVQNWDECGSVFAVKPGLHSDGGGSDHTRILSDLGKILVEVASVLLRPPGLLFALRGGSSSEKHRLLEYCGCPPSLGEWLDAPSCTVRVPVILIDAYEDVWPYLADEREEEVSKKAEAARLSRQLGLRCHTAENHIVPSSASAFRASCRSRRVGCGRPCVGSSADCIQGLAEFCTSPVRCRSLANNGGAKLAGYNRLCCSRDRASVPRWEF